MWELLSGSAQPLMSVTAVAMLPHTPGQTSGSQGTCAIERSAAQHALYLYVHWLEKLLEEEAIDAYDLAYVEAMCERYFS